MKQRAAAFLALIALAVVCSGAAFNTPTSPVLTLSNHSSGARVLLRGMSNFLFTLHGSTNLQQWTLLNSNVATNPLSTFIDGSTTNRRMRFYKGASLVTPLFYRGSYTGTESGSFILMARTNNTALFIGVSPGTGRRRGELASVSINTNSVACGSFIAGAPGCITFATNGTLAGSYTNGLNSGPFTGIQTANNGPYRGLAGLYTGTVAGVHSGPAQLLLCPDGSLAFYRVDNYNGNKKDAGVSKMDSGNTMDVYLSGSAVMHVLGSFSLVQRRFSLTLHEEDGLVSTVTLNFTEPVF